MGEAVVDRGAPIVLGQIGRAHGVRGWVRVRSYTDPDENILNYRRWLVSDGSGWSAFELLEGRPHGRVLIARLDGVATREAAEALQGRDIAVPRQELPPLAQDEYYWADLIGLQVLTVDGVDLGRVRRLIRTGANDVLVVRGDRERLIPMVLDRYVVDVDLAAGRMRVDWDPDF